MTSLNDSLIALPTEKQGFLFAAQEMLTGAKHLELVRPIPVLALTLLCGHACETALKALLAQNGIPASTLRTSSYGHEILNLWTSVETNGVPLPVPQPEWVAQLARVYKSPFSLRYPLGFHGIVLPDPIAMLRGTESLVEMAILAVR